MRADRLLSLLMLLQTRGRMTARELAGSLEVSERTIYRDIEALSMAGAPVYAERGPGGGCALLDDYRTTLTGLTSDEVRALFMLSIPEPLAEMGVSAGLRSALLKLSASLPAARRAEESRVRARVYLDWSAPSAAPVAPFLGTVQKAVWDDRELRLSYRLPVGGLEVRLEVAPYGLVAQSGVWWLVVAHAGQLRVLRLSDLLAAELSARKFERPADFDLQSFWKQWRAEQTKHQPTYVVTARLAPEVLPYLAYYFGPQVAAQAAAQPAAAEGDGWRTLTLHFDSLETARERLLSLGGAVIVLAPEALRLSVADWAEQIVKRYR
jgi:predicted DNA-binding transcriptional regulator YafY